MVQALALKTVHVCRKPGKKSPEGNLLEPAKIDVVVAGSIFDLEEKQFAELEKEGAVRKASKLDLAKAEDGLVPLDPATGEVAANP